MTAAFQMLASLSVQLPLQLMQPTPYTNHCCIPEACRNHESHLNEISCCKTPNIVNAGVFLFTF